MTSPFHTNKPEPRKPRPWWFPAALGFGSGIGVFLISLPWVYHQSPGTRPATPPPAQQPAAPEPTTTPTSPAMAEPTISSGDVDPATLRGYEAMDREDRFFAASALAQAFCLEKQGNAAAAPALALTLQQRGLQVSVVSETPIQELAAPIVRQLCP